MSPKFVIVIFAASLAAQPGIDFGIGNARVTRDGRAVAEEKTAEARAACKITNALGSVADLVGGVPAFDTKGLGAIKTAGWLRTGGNSAIKVGSSKVRGATRPAGWRNQVEELFSGNRYSQADAAKIAHHAEGQAAGLMRERGITRATLDINNNYVCRECLWFVEHILPEGYELIVRYIDTAGNPRQVSFCGMMRSRRTLR